MKKILIVFSFVVLTGCVEYPVYHSHTQTIDISPIRRQYPEAEILYDNEIQHSDKIDVFRSWFDKELIVRQKGFKDYHLNLESVWSDDAWAEGYCVGMGCSKNDKSTISLLNPGQLLWMPVGVVGILTSPIQSLDSLYFYNMTEQLKVSVKAIFLYPYNLISVIGAPLVNPWKEYDIRGTQQKILLEPIND